MLKNVKRYQKMLRNVKRRQNMLRNVKNDKRFRNISDGRTDRPTDQGVESRARD